MLFKICEKALLRFSDIASIQNPLQSVHNNEIFMLM